MPDCLLFDLFGTLVDYEADLSKHSLPGTHQLANDLGAAADQAEHRQAWDDAFAALHATSRQTGLEFHMDQVAERVVDRLQIDCDGLARARLIDTYIEEWASRVIPVVGIRGLISRLHGHYRLGLITNTHYPPMVMALLDAMDIRQFFDSIVTSAEFGQPKPASAIFNAALLELGVEPGQAVYIGDSYEMDYLGALNAGLDCYLIGSHARVPRDRRLRSILDLAIHFKTDRL